VLPGTAAGDDDKAVVEQAHGHSLLTIVFEDRHLLVVVKPAGMVMHPAYHHPDGTLWNLLADLFASRGVPERPHLLHRLDRETSGLVCVPKRLPAHRSLERMLRAGLFDKRYLALVEGSTPLCGTISAPLGRDLLDRRRACVRVDGQRAVTHFTALRRFQHCTLLRVKLETGRMHQIRAHLAHLGHPLLGDCTYGGGPAVSDRLFLHADRLAFPHPITRALIECRAPLPPDLRLALHRLSRVEALVRAVDAEACGRA
jgi:RluA family pseudouridine synthase